MGFFSSKGGDEPRVIKGAGKGSREQYSKPKMHGSHAERNLMGGRGALIRWSGDHVQVSGEKPGRQR